MVRETGNRVRAEGEAEAVTDLGWLLMSGFALFALLWWYRMRGDE